MGHDPMSAGRSIWEAYVLTNEFKRLPRSFHLAAQCGEHSAADKLGRTYPTRRSFRVRRRYSYVDVQRRHAYMSHCSTGWTPPVMEDAKVKSPSQLSHRRPRSSGGLSVMVTARPVLRGIFGTAVRPAC